MYVCESLCLQLPHSFLSLVPLLRLAPLKHCSEVSEAVNGFSISGISVALEADLKPTSVFSGVGSEDTSGEEVMLVFHEATTIFSLFQGTSISTSGRR